MKTKTHKREAQTNATNETNETSAKKVKKSGFFKTMLPYLATQKRRIVLAMLASTFAGVCVAIQPLIIKYIVDDAIGAETSTSWLLALFRRIFGVESGVTVTFQIQMILTLAMLYLVIAFLRTFVWGFGIHNLYNAMEGTLFSLRSRFFNKIQHMCMRFYDNNSSGELFNCIMGSPMANIRMYLNNIVMSVPHQIVTLVITLFALFSFDWRLTLILLATALLMTYTTYLQRQRIRKRSREYLAAEREASKYITDMLHGADAVKMYAIEDIAVENVDKYLTRMKEKGAANSFAGALDGFKREIVNYIGIAVIYMLGGYYCVTNHLSVGVLYAFLSSMTSILGILTSWLALFTQHANAETAMERIDRVMHENSSTPEADTQSLRSVEVERHSAMENGKPCISFKNVTFAYDNKNVFQGLNCDIAFGESIGLVGSSGSGKSTFTKLAMRLYEINGGEILVYGKDIRSFPTRDLRLSFGVVPQAPFIFHGTIWDNIRLARPDADGYDIIKAMEIAHVHEFVNELPMGWSTVIGDGALGLSGGQKQRIAIARAVLKNPDILIFDEATSALDNVSEHHIRQAMEDLMKTHTVLIVAHRLSTVRNVDRILVFDQGEIVDSGSYDELAARDGLFRQFLDSAEAKIE